MLSSWNFTLAANFLELIFMHQCLQMVKKWLISYLKTCKMNVICNALEEHQGTNFKFKLGRACGALGFWWPLTATCKSPTDMLNTEQTKWLLTQQQNCLWWTSQVDLFLLKLTWIQLRLLHWISVISTQCSAHTHSHSHHIWLVHLWPS